MRPGEPALWVVEFEPVAHKIFLFSEIYDRQPELFKSKKNGFPAPVVESTPGFDPEAWLMRNVYYWFHENHFQSATQAEIFSKNVCAAAEQILQELRKNGNATNIKWPSDSFPFIPKNPLSKSSTTNIPLESDEIRRLTFITSYSKTGSVKSELAKLIERVKRAAARSGAKSELARLLKVAPARITEWLRDDPNLRIEPGGHYTLELLRWVEQQERQK